MSGSRPTAQRVFISYSRADRRRVAGIASLLEGLGHQVFVDRRSILAGRRWRDRLASELETADVLVVFWTRHAAASRWVRFETERFDELHPQRPLVPVLGDGTPLSRHLATRQHVDFYPVLNELMELVERLEADGQSRRKIRAAVIEHLEKHGISLPRDDRKRVFALVGVVSVGSAIPHVAGVFLDHVADRVIGIPTAAYVTAGAAAAGGFITCHMLPDWSSASQPELHPVIVSLGQTGSDACDASGMICVSMARAPIFDIERRYFGFSTPTCAAKVVRHETCHTDYGTEFALSGVVIRRSPDAHAGVKDLSSATHFCLSSDAGKQGQYHFANCVEP